MDYSEIIIYIIVISIIFISSFKKKKTSKSQPDNTERSQKTDSNIPEPVTPHNPPSPPQNESMIIKPMDKVFHASNIHNLQKTTDNAQIIRDPQPDVYNTVSNNAPELNREELRKAIITYEILKTKF